MQYEIKVVVDPVCIAHKLNLPYISVCNKLHGHGYRVEVALTAHELGPTGMVVDFTFLKDVVKRYDHTFLGHLPAGIGVEMLEALGVELISEAAKVDPSTCENFGRILFIELQKELNIRHCAAVLKYVRLWETPNNQVTVSND